MLDLKLRQEFLGKLLKGTAIELANSSKTGATQISAQRFLEITFPTHDLLKAIEAIGPNQGRPVAVIGERGLGKSHIMAALFHAVTDEQATRAWLNSWSTTLDDHTIAKIKLHPNLRVIEASLHLQRHKFLWDLLFDNHPYGEYIKGKWAGMGADKPEIPSDQLILELVHHTPVMLLLDEFQIWYEGLTNTKQYPRQTWAFNFIQILSEIAKEYPNLLVLVVSVRDGNTDAYKQIHRVNPVQIDFKAGGNPARMQHDRRRMLLHRMFENRLHISPKDIDTIIVTHVAEYFRLLDVPPLDHERKHQDFIEAWPFAPHLLQLLEDQVLVATDAQETRDMIRILANLFKSRGEATPILTAADFRLDDDESGIGALLDSVSSQHHRMLREKAQRNIAAVTDAVSRYYNPAPHFKEIIGSLWLRSIAVGNLAGAEPAVLQADITREYPIDDNLFQVELETIVENSFNIHQDGARLVFREAENPQAKLMAYARNNKLADWLNGSDAVQLAKEIRYVISGFDDVAKSFRIIVLPKTWLTDPWSSLEAAEHPDQWDDRLPILVLPETPDKLNERLGGWLKEHLAKRRNTIRFLLPRSGTQNAFQKGDLIILARVVLKAWEWSSQNQEYKKLHTKYQGDLREILKKRFDRFAVLGRWHFTEPAQCEFHIESLQTQGAQIPQAIEYALLNDLFVPEDFEEFVQLLAVEHKSIGQMLRELQEPRPANELCIPWLGETSMKERILRLCARGKIAINLRGKELLQIQPGEDEEGAWLRLRSKLYVTGRQLDEIFLQLPAAVPTTGGVAPIQKISSPTSLKPSGTDYPFPSGMESTGFPSSEIFAKPAPDTPKVTLTNPATSALNLIGKLENWGIGPATQVNGISIQITTASGAQLKELLKKLPDGMTFAISLEKEES